MSNQITVKLNGTAVSAFSGQRLSDIVKIDSPCGNHGKCGKCKVIARGNISEISESEFKYLTNDELKRNVRLACLTVALGDCEIVTYSEASKAKIITDSHLTRFEPKPAFSNYGIAVDIGTTTIAAKLYNTEGGIISETAILNPQAKFGADVISRIERSLSGNSKDLTQSVRDALNDIIVTLTASLNGDVDFVVITGNTVMLSILTGESVKEFSHAPFNVPRLFGETIAAWELSLDGLKADTPIYLPPCISAFVGADISCAILATDLHNCEAALLADIGTNGELALCKNGKITVCSTAAGPAFEGVGISKGMRGTVGAIDKIETVDGKFITHVIGNVQPIGICGSGLIDAASVMLDSNIIDESGYLEDDTFTIVDPVTITSTDIRMLQLAKSAICAGLLTLLDAENLNISGVSHLYIAGGFGNYLNVDNAAKIGLLPKKLADIAVPVGNAALAGASMILLNSDMIGVIEAIANTASVLELSANAVFSEYYVTGMIFDEM